MNILLSNNHSRKELLVANSLAKETLSNLMIFDPINIYDYCISNTQNKFLIISDKDYNNIYIKKFIDDIVENKINVSTNIIILQDKIDIPKHKLFHFIDIKSFCAYNEYANLDKIQFDNKYILCELNCLSLKKNSIIDPIIYPLNNQFPVRLVNCPRFDHPQNVGIVNDSEMIKLIAGSMLFISLTDNYIYDAINMGKPIITTESNKIIQPIDSIDLANLEIYKLVNPEHKNILQTYKISNIIKYKFIK